MDKTRNQQLDQMDIMVFPAKELEKHLEIRKTASIMEKVLSQKVFKALENRLNENFLNQVYE